MTPRLRLRPLDASDADGLTDIYLHPLVARWIGPHTASEVAREVALQAEYQATFGWSLWAVEDRASGALLGDCGLQPLEHRGPEVELGYDFDPSAWGRGLATEAGREVIRQAFGPLGLERVVAVVKPGHAASRRVLEKLGFEHDGTRQAYGEELLLYASERPGR